MRRDITRRQRYDKKLSGAEYLNVDFVTVNFSHDENLASIIRNAACFGVKNIHVIGSVPPRNFLNPRSGSLVDYVNIKSYRNPTEFTEFAKDNDIELISAELSIPKNTSQNPLFSVPQKSSHKAGSFGSRIGSKLRICLNSEFLFE